MTVQVVWRGTYATLRMLHVLLILPSQVRFSRRNAHPKTARCSCDRSPTTVTTRLLLSHLIRCPTSTSSAQPAPWNLRPHRCKRRSGGDLACAAWRRHPPVAQFPLRQAQCVLRFALVQAAELSLAQMVPLLGHRWNAASPADLPSLISEVLCMHVWISMLPLHFAIARPRPVQLKGMIMNLSSLSRHATLSLHSVGAKVIQQQPVQVRLSDCSPSLVLSIAAVEPRRRGRLFSCLKHRSRRARSAGGCAASLRDAL